MRISRRGQTAPFRAMDVLAAAQRLETAGRDVVHMEVGEPAFGAPAAARRALEAAFSAGETLGYTGGLGIPALRQAIAGLYRRRHGLAIDPARVVVTAGSSAAFQLAFLGLFEAGARVGIADPGYPAYRNILFALGLEAVRIETHLATRYQPVPSDVPAADGLDGLLVASPANPTGTMLDRPALEALTAACADEGAILICDEIYHGLTYGDAAVSALEVTDDVIVIGSFSKYYAMTGWRIGWMVVPEGLVRPLETLAQNLFICPPHASQVAALGALSADGEAEVARHLESYRANRRAVVAALPALGFRDIAPCDGAFYAYARLPEGEGDSTEFCERLLAEQGVALTPGLDFDPVRGDETVRLSFAQAPDRIAEGLRRLEAFMAREPAAV
ncbi:MAG: aminotransferase class I/II-fold pyridoxal phosphate-dependent enzyme [Pseudomonadota bacterium]